MTIKPRGFPNIYDLYDEDKLFEQAGWFFDRDWEDLDKGLADSIATYLNARYLENKGWTN